LIAKYSKIKRVKTVVGSYRNGSKRKLDSRVMRRHREDRKRDRVSEERYRRKSR